MANIIIVGNQNNPLDPKSTPNSDSKIFPRKHFLERALREAVYLSISKRQNNEPTTIVVYKGLYSKETLAYYEKMCLQNNIQFKVADTSQQIVDFVNFGDKNDRGKDLITDFMYIGHSTPDTFLLGYYTEYDDNHPVDPDAITTNSVGALPFSKWSFHREANASFLSCGSALGSIFNDFKERLVGGNIFGYNTTVIWGSGGRLGEMIPSGLQYYLPNDARRNDADRPKIAFEKCLKTERGNPLENGSPTNDLVNNAKLNTIKSIQINDSNAPRLTRAL